MTAQPDSYLIRIEAILREIWDELDDEKPIDPDAPLLQLGVDSILLVTLLSRAETELGVEWDPSTPPSEFESLRSIARIAARSAKTWSGRHEH
jgi:acyl carrier protein